MLAWAVLMASSPAIAGTGAVFGVELRPLSRGDLTWVAEGNTSGEAVGALDGFVRPNLQAYGGVVLGDTFVVLGSLGVARLQTTVRADDVVTQQHVGVVRPALDLRVRLAEAAPLRPVPHLVAGFHLAIPSARDTSSCSTL